MIAKDLNPGMGSLSFVITKRLIVASLQR